MFDGLTSVFLLLGGAAPGSVLPPASTVAEDRPGEDVGFDVPEPALPQREFSATGRADAPAARASDSPSDATVTPLPAPEPGHVDVGLKTGWLDPREAPQLPTVNLELVLRGPAWSVGPAGHWLQLQLPQSYYWITTDSGSVWVADARLRAEWGPSWRGWLPGFATDIGYLWQSRDWAGGLHGGSIHGLLVGGAVNFPLRRIPAVMHLKFGKTLTAVDYAKFSCGLRWYPWAHVGFHLHGENFWRDMGDHSAKYSGFFGGVIVRW